MIPMRSIVLMVLAIIDTATLSTSNGNAAEFWQVRTYKDCDKHLRGIPFGYACYRSIARREQSWSEGIRHLEGRLALTPTDDRSRIALGTLLADIYDERVEAVMHQAADNLEARNDLETAAYARLELFATLIGQERLEEADAELARAAEDAERSGSDTSKDYVELNRGVSAAYHRDHAAAWAHYKKVEAKVLHGSNVHLQGLVLEALGDTTADTGRHAEALAFHRRAAQVWHESEDYFTEAYVLLKVNRDTRMLEIQSGIPDPNTRSATFEQALGAARRGGNLAASQYLLFQEAQDPGRPVGEKLELLERALADARRMRSPKQIGYVLRYKAHLLASTTPARRPEAEAILEEALKTARRSGATEQEARAMLQVATIHMDAGERARAIPEWLAVLDMLERLRDHEPDERVRAGIQSNWAFIYYRVARYVLQEAGPGAAVEEIDLALSVIERMRARVLLASLDAAGAATGGTSGDSPRERAEVLARIARAQRGLLSPILAEAERSLKLSALEQLEAQEAVLRQQIASVDPAFAALRTPVIPSTRQLQEALGPDEALLSFQSDVDVSKPGWGLLLTRETSRPFPLPDRATLNDEVSLFLGLMERRDGSEAAGAARLYADLMKEALADLPSPITRLVLVPDGPLHRLPFDVLRQDVAGEPLANRFDISLAPSCSTWLRWNQIQGEEAVAPVLALADPLVSAGPDVPATYRAATLASGLSLGPLPRARDEARFLVSRLGGESRLVLGDEATERFVKTADLGRYRMLHLAAHAVVDDQHSERSAVLLAPGADDEDGLLQIREIASLDLRGRLVVLSSCSSASGSMVEGEGVMGLARAFFQAGAIAVVGSLWPMVDEEAAGLVNRMAVHLGRGASISSALAAARRESIKAGAPAAAWSGLVVLGNGDFVPLPGGRASSAESLLFIALTAALILVAGALVIRRARMRGTAPHS